MAIIEKHKPGSFCWVELGTSSQIGAKQFYGPLFGWATNDFPMGPDEFYTIFRVDGQDTGGGYTLKPDMLAQGVPPHWILYIAVDSADAAANKAAEAGATVVAPAFDVMSIGRMAVLKDPTGAVFCVWENKGHKGTGITAVPGTLCWADLSTPDQAAAAKFYADVFGWELTPGEDTSGYLHIKNGEDFIGGVPTAEQRAPDAPPHWMLYFQVESCDAATDQAKQLGGRVYMEPFTMERVGRMSVVADPQGAVFSLFEPMPNA